MAFTIPTKLTRTRIVTTVSKVDDESARASVSNNNLNQLTPGGSIVSNREKEVPKNRQQDPQGEPLAPVPPGQP